METRPPYHIAPTVSSWCRLSALRSPLRLAAQLVVGQALSEYPADRPEEPISVLASTLVVPIRLLVQVAEQVEWLDADVGAAQGAVEQGPEVFHRVSVHHAVHILDSVVDGLMGI